jgi:RNA polymerase sigma-70 factor (ECF subfamily)
MSSLPPSVRQPSPRRRGGPRSTRGAHAWDSARLLSELAAAWPHLLRWAHGRLPARARHGTDTSDLVQDALLHTLRRRRTLDIRTQEAVAVYLRTCVRNRVRDARRRLATHDGTAGWNVSPAEAPPSPLQALLADERAARYRRALARLRPLDRDLIVAHVELGYTHEQVACMMGRSRGAARMALHRALDRLIERLRDA